MSDISLSPNDKELSQTNLCSIFFNFEPEAGPHGTSIADGHLENDIHDLLSIHLDLDTPLKGAHSATIFPMKLAHMVSQNAS